MNTNYKGIHLMGIHPPTPANAEQPATKPETPRTIMIMRGTDSYRYQVTRQKHTSDHYGQCEVCGKPAAVVHHQVEQRRFVRDDRRHGWTTEDCSDRFGHLDCLSQLRRFDTDNPTFETGMTVRRPNGRLNTIEHLGTLLSMDAALIREVTPHLAGHKPRELWMPLTDLKIVQSNHVTSDHQESHHAAS